MLEFEFTENDWKQFRKNLPIWQERYMTRLLEGYTKLLCSDEPASTKFWELEERIRNDQKKTGVIARRISRSNMHSLMLELIDEKAITRDDLEGFSEIYRNLLSPYINRSNAEADDDSKC